MSKNKVLLGGLAGGLATLPMTLAMRGIHMLLPRRERYALPPYRIMRWLGRRAGLWQQAERHERVAATALGHVGYGALTGALYALLPPALRARPALAGPGYGLAVWLLSYQGWLPALGVLPPPSRKPAGRNAMAIASHLVWGAGTSVLLDRLMRDEKFNHRGTEDFAK